MVDSLFEYDIISQWSKQLKDWLFESIYYPTEISYRCAILPGNRVYWTAQLLDAVLSTQTRRPAWKSWQKGTFLQLLKLSSLLAPLQWLEMFKETDADLRSPLAGLMAFSTIDTNLSHFCLLPQKGQRLHMLDTLYCDTIRHWNPLFGACTYFFKIFDFLFGF